MTRVLFYTGVTCTVLSQVWYALGRWSEYPSCPQAIRAWVWQDSRPLFALMWINPLGTIAMAFLAWLADAVGVPDSFVPLLHLVSLGVGVVWWAGIARAIGIIARLLNRSRLGRERRPEEQQRSDPKRDC